ncbi:S8 family serine peptidase [Streptomyces sp. NPDC047706]|uniref:S8 family serine peptidase n=1 Tax=Streptomyces sp. NPDC047706 TaxID=3365486 RepID=UPI0037216EF7
MLVTLVPAVAGTEAGPRTGPGADRSVGPRAAMPGQRVITLISGDRFAFTGSAGALEVAGVTPARGREHIAFTRIRADGHEYVIPVDATEALGSGRLDRQFFDITALVAQGLYDTARADIPPIVTAEAGPALRSSTQREAFSSLGLTAHTVRKSETATAWRGFLAAADGASRTAGRYKLWLDAKVKASLDRSVAMTGAPSAWGKGLDGKGVKVAVLDSGYDLNHPDLKNRISAERNFTWDESVADLNGHGTHVASGVFNDRRIR